MTEGGPPDKARLEECEGRRREAEAAFEAARVRLVHWTGLYTAAYAEVNAALDANDPEGADRHLAEAGKIFPDYSNAATAFQQAMRDVQVALKAVIDAAPMSVKVTKFEAQLHSAQRAGRALPDDGGTPIQ